MRGTAQVDAAICLGNRFVFQQQFDVTIVLIGGQVGALPVVDQFTIVNGPVHTCFFHPLGQLSHSLCLGHGSQFAMIKMRDGMPATQILAIEDGCETLGNFRGLSLCEGTAGQQETNAKYGS